MKRFIVVANRTGGQGKTLISLLLLDFLSGEGRPAPLAMCADSSSGSDGVSKLGRILKDVVEVGSGPSSKEVQESPAKAFEYWDGISETILDAPEGTSIVFDVGANVIDRVLEWGVASSFQAAMGDDVSVDLVVPVVAKPRSMADAAEVIRKAVQGEGIRFKRIFLVCNEWQGGFADEVALLSEWKDLLAIARKHSLCLVSLSRCMSSLLAIGDSQHTGPADLSSLSPADVAETFGWARTKAARELRSFSDWRNETRRVFAERGLIDGPGSHGSLGELDGRAVADAVPR